TVTINSNTGTLTGIDVVSNNNAGAGAITIAASILGDSSVVIDGNVASLATGVVNTVGRLALGGQAGTVTTGAFLSGTLDTNAISAVNVNGRYGSANPDVSGEVGIDLLNVGALTISGVASGRINVERDIGSLNLGTVETSLIRAGGGIGSFISGRLAETRVSVGDFLTSATINADMFDSMFLIGADLGSDADFGGIDGAADRLTSGFAGNFTIAGDFEESDIVAGFTRGPDGFFGTPDDSLAPGRSTIGNVTIGGDNVGSGFNSESFRIATTGTVGTVTVDNRLATATGNFAIDRPGLDPEPIQIVDLVVSESARVYTASIFFNQPIDLSTIPSSLAVSEVRGVGEVEIRLIDGLDFTTEYDRGQDELRITFARDITERDLPQLPGVPGAGIFRFTLDADALRGASAGALLDGDGDGFATEDDDFSEDDIVGDAGDKIADQQTSVTGVTGLPVNVDFRAPTNLDIVLDNNVLPDQLPDPNTTFTLRGTIGDHPDHSSTVFRFAADQDVYSITLQAGQILRIDEAIGQAANIPITLITPADESVNVNNFGDFRADGTGDLAFLPNDTSSLTRQFVTSTIDPIVQDVITRSYLVKTTGQYLLVVGTLPELIDDLTTVPNTSPVPGQLGAYAFDISIFDDGDSGFAATSDAGDGAAIVNAPQPSAFAGPDGQFGTADDQATFQTGAFTFTLNPGADGVRGTGDDSVTGDNNFGISSTRVGSTLITNVNASIGTARFAGVPNEVFPDVDILHLNNRGLIAPGTNMTITVQLDQLGADLGSTVFGGNVQFALFDTTNATSVDDAVLVFAPTDFSPNGGEPGVIASGINGTYGYDANGDFFISFRTPGAVGSEGVDPARYAVMIQGVVNTDYALTIVTTPPTTPTTQLSQNILLETQGGLVDWLLADGSDLELEGFDANVLGFTGILPNGQEVESYILAELTQTLNGIFAAAGLDVNFSTSSASFEFQDFSTVFISDTPDPLNTVFGGGVTSALDAFFSDFVEFSSIGTEPFGFSERSDPLNIDRNDEAVVFAPSLSLLGLDPSLADVDRFVLSLSAAVGRRVGELLGLQITASHAAGEVDDDGADLFDLFSADSVTRRPGGMLEYTISTNGRLLSTSIDGITGTDFFLGRQNAGGLLSLYVL
ncbi:MAG: hypothetical protein AAGK04_09330, partial [Planctomycetota bacterium]